MKVQDPTISDFTNAQHDHTSAASGDATANFTVGLLVALEDATAFNTVITNLQNALVL
jgi:hypothetical protein